MTLIEVVIRVEHGRSYTFSHDFCQAKIFEDPQLKSLIFSEMPKGNYIF